MEITIILGAVLCVVGIGTIFAVVAAIIMLRNKKTKRRWKKCAAKTRCYCTRRYLVRSEEFRKPRKCRILVKHDL